MSNLKIMIGRLLEKLSGGGKSSSDNDQTQTLESNPWQTDLYRLARERGLEGELLSKDETVNTQLQELKDSVSKDTKVSKDKDAKDTKDTKNTKNTTKDEPDNDEDAETSDKPRRKTSETATDMKAWWGQAVATWDPADGKNVDSVEKKIRGPQSNKWFH